MRLLSLALLCTVVLCLVGCGPGTSAPSPESPPPEVSSEQQFKERLQFIADNGGMGSAFAGIVEMAEKTGDSSLVTDAKKLVQVQTPEQAKTIAKSMLGKLK